MVTTETRILRQICRQDLDAQQKQQIVHLWQQKFDPTRLLEQAEQHGLGPLLHHHVSSLELDPGDSLRQQLLALTIRHRRANQARATAIGEILQCFSGQQIRSVLLKGSALMFVLYDSPALRPMSDIDLLVTAEQAGNAQLLLQNLGYHIHENHNPYLRDHHHLPMAQKQIDGVSIHIEIHTDALSRDIIDSIRLDRLSEPTQQFTVDEQTAEHLGHSDMLRHLCHHTLEPVVQIKLGAVADLYGYASRYLDQIDTARLDADYPFVRNTFTLLHYLSPLPESLQHWIKTPQAPPPKQIGSGFTPLSQTLSGNNSVVGKLSGILVPPHWWAHCFYCVPAEKSLIAVRFWRHPKQVLTWLLRRWRAKRNW